MSVAEAAPATDSLSLALAFHQAPGHFPELLRGVAPLPPDMGRLLRAAGGAAAEGELPAATPFGQADCRTAARFFIEQVLLARDADHYRVLGVNPDAPIEQIKEHHRLLMRVFHPDRKEDASVVADSIAARINLAYNALRLPDDRAAYDARRREMASVAPGLRGVPRARLKAGAPVPARSLPPWLARYLPQFVLAGVAVIATGAVAWVYVNQEPSGALGGGGGVGNGSPAEVAEVTLPIREPLPKVAPVEVKAAPRVAVLTPAVAAAKEAPVPVREEPARVEIPPRVAEPVRKAEPPASESARKPEPALPEPPRVATPATPAENVKLALSRTVRTEAQPAVAPSAPPMATAAPAQASPPAPAPAPIEAPVTTAPAQPTAMVTAPQAAVSAPVQKPVVVAAVPAPEPRRGVTLDDLVKLVAQFSSEYERGDLERFLALFDDGARVEGGGKERIRTDYADLFRTTQARQLIIYDMRWAAEGELYRGEGQYRAKVQRQGEDATRTYTGKIRIDAVPGAGGLPRVKGLFH